MDELFPSDLRESAKRILLTLERRAMLIAAAESCTGGLLTGLLTEIPGASGMVERGFVTYSNVAKAEMLGVSSDLIVRHGAVSEEVARAMAEGALRCSPAHIATAITGVAGPDGGSPEKPVGLVYIAVAQREAETLARECRFGDIGRNAIRLGSVREALTLTQEALDRSPA